MELFFWVMAQQVNTKMLLNFPLCPSLILGHNGVIMRPESRRKKNKCLALLLNLSMALATQRNNSGIIYVYSRGKKTKYKETHR